MTRCPWCCGTFPNQAAKYEAGGHHRDRRRLPIGAGKDEFWRSLLAGRSGVGRCTLSIRRLFRCISARRFPISNPNDTCGDSGRTAWGGLRNWRLPRRAWRWTIRIPISPVRPQPRGRVMGTTSGEPQFIERYNDSLAEGGEDAIPAEIYPRYPCHVIPGHIAMEFDLARAVSDDPDRLRGGQLRHRLRLRPDPHGPRRHHAVWGGRFVLAHHLYGFRATRRDRAGALPAFRQEPQGYGPG